MLLQKQLSNYLLLTYYIGYPFCQNNTSTLHTGMYLTKNQEVMLLGFYITLI